MTALRRTLARTLLPGLLLAAVSWALVVHVAPELPTVIRALRWHVVVAAVVLAVAWWGERTGRRSW